MLDGYARGVNAWAEAHSLPPEYPALQLSRFDPWLPVDSVLIAKLLAFDLSFELDIARTIALQSYIQAGAALGFDGVKLFSEDLWRSAGFEPNATVLMRRPPPCRALGATGSSAAWTGRKQNVTAMLRSI